MVVGATAATQARLRIHYATGSPFAPARRPTGVGRECGHGKIARDLGEHADQDEDEAHDSRDDAEEVK